MRHLFIFNIHVCLESTFIPSCLLYYCRVFRWARAAGLRPHLCNPGASIQQVSTRSIYHKNFTSSLYYSLDFSTVGVHILFHGLVVYELCLAVLFILDIFSFIWLPIVSMASCSSWTHTLLQNSLIPSVWMDCSDAISCVKWTNTFTTPERLRLVILKKTWWLNLFQNSTTHIFGSVCLSDSIVFIYYLDGLHAPPQNTC